ncbi:MAG: shikimate dehydrogenase [Planctomycetota bacterium]
MTKTQPVICVATHHASIGELLSDAEFLGLANREGFLVELRLDFFNDLTDASLDRALAVFTPNALVTYRHPSEGGKRPGVSDDERLRVLQRAADHGVKFIDIEARTSRDGFNKRGATLILSYHDFESSPDVKTLQSIWQSIASSPDVDVVKMAVMPKTVADTFAAHSFLQAIKNGANPGAQTILLCMGEAGLWSRVLAGYFGAPFTYARGEGASGTAPGQPTWRELDSLYRFRQIDSSWRVYAVIGNPVGHSLSPLMHNTAFEELGIPAVYLPFKVEGNPVEFIREFGRVLNGVSVTIPHKETIVACCAEVDAGVRTIGAMNTLNPITIVADGSKTWAGSNTDAAAAADSLEAGLGTLQGKHVLVIGAGGAARAVAVGVKERGALVSVLNRTRERAETLAKEVGGVAVSFDDLAHLKIDAIVNTTPLGMHPNVDASPLEENQIPKDGLVFDTVYNPFRTKLLELAEKRGCTTIEGLSMFIGQGVRQFELWTGKKAPRELMHRVVLEALKKRRQ